jgi:thiamine-monophosphate kinase
MALSEFYLIRRYFARQAMARSDVVLGVGDDGALLEPLGGEQLVVTTDMLAADVHFRVDARPEGIGHKALAVNLSDLAAMGARPAWVTLSLALPDPDEVWLAAFSRGFLRLAEQFRVQLIGGDMTRGPLTICVQALGFVPRGQAMRRDAARPGDVIFVTGTPGDAGMALALDTGRVTVPEDARAYFRARLDRPTPRVAQGLALRGLANAAIDISDGLIQDLGHILERSGVGACLFLDQLPRSPALAVCGDEPAVLAAQLGGGDDYELCFTITPSQLPRLRRIAVGWDCRCTEIGVIEAAPGLRCQRSDGTFHPLVGGGYDHFA